MFWNILGIEPTTDKEIITNAYRTLLAETNPEDKPEEFMQLRAAFEEAMAYAEEGPDTEIRESEATEETDVQRWGKKLEALYDDFRSRNDPECWRELMSDPVCTAIDSKMQVEETMLCFFMDNYTISNRIFRLLNEYFDWSHRAEELCESYPKEFIDFIIDCMSEIDLFPLELFIPGTNAADAHEYIALYRTLFDDPDETDHIIEKMNALSEKHPYGECCIYFHRFSTGDVSALTQLKELSDRYPRDRFITYYLAESYLKAERFDECLALCKDFYDNADNTNIKIVRCIAKAYDGMGNTQEAYEFLNCFLRLNYRQDNETYDLEEYEKGLALKLIPEYRTRMEKDPDDKETCRSLCWILMQTDQEEGATLAARIGPEDCHPFDYYNLKFSAAEMLKKNDEALDYVTKLIDLIKGLEDDGTEETRTRIKRLCTFYLRKAGLLFSMKRYEEAIECLTEALDQFPDTELILNSIADTYLTIGDLESADVWARRAVECAPTSTASFNLFAYILYSEGLDREALDAVNRSLNLDRYALNQYILKFRIFCRNEAYEPAKEVLDTLAGIEGIDSCPDLEYCIGLYEECANDNNEEAKKHYKKAYENIDRVFCRGVKAEIAYCYMWFAMENMDLSLPENCSVIDEIAQKGLAENPTHYGILMTLADYYKDSDKNDKAMECYRTLEKKKNHNSEVDRRIGLLLYKDLIDDPHPALEYFLKAASKNPAPADWFYIGMCQYYLREYKEAEEALLKLQEMAPDDVDSYKRLTILYTTTKEYEKALTNVETLIKLVKQRDKDMSYYYGLKIRILRRMNRKDDAIAFIRSAKSDGKYEDADIDLYNCYMAFGMYEEAEEFSANRYEDSHHKDASAAKDYINVLIMQDKLAKAKMILGKAKCLSPETKNELVADLAALKGNYKPQLARYEKLLADNSNDADEKAQYQKFVAETYLLMGKTDKVHELAEAALKSIDAELERYDVYRPLYQTRKAKALVLLGRIEEAEELLEVVTTGHLCQHCDYSGCKDAYVISLLIEFVKGDYKKGLELAKLRAEEYPDELDYHKWIAEFERRIK